MWSHAINNVATNLCRSLLGLKPSYDLCCLLTDPSTAPAVTKLHIHPGCILFTLFVWHKAMVQSLLRFSYCRYFVLQVFKGCAPPSLQSTSTKPSHHLPAAFKAESHHFLLQYCVSLAFYYQVFSISLFTSMHYFSWTFQAFDLERYWDLSITHGCCGT